jgi:hypothetical protein
MLTTVLVGSSQTYLFEGYMVTPRGYANKYTAEGDVRSGQRPGYSLVVDAAVDLALATGAAGAAGPVGAEVE